jgi:hypothetical protein
VYKDRPAILIARSEQEPKIDGKLDEPAWKKAEAYEMRRLDGDVAKLPNPTFVRLLATDKALYVAFQCKDKDGAHLKSRERPRDESIWEDDSVEIFIRAGADPAKDYFQLAINPAGSFMDARGRDNAAWQGNPKIGVNTDKDEWTAEVMIPLVELQMKQEQVKGGPWRLNLTRMRQPRDGDEAEEGALAPTESSDNHVPSMFAYAWLEALGGKLPADAEKPAK